MLCMYALACHTVQYALLQCVPHASHTWYITTLQLCMHTNSTHWIVDTLVHLSTKHEAEQHQTTYIPTHEAIVVY